MAKPSSHRQFLWELWFTSSIVIMLTLVFVMTLDNSKAIASLPYILGASFINLCIALYIGITTEE